MKDAIPPGYRAQSADTDIEIDRRLISAYGAMDAFEKARRIAADSRAVEQLARAGIGIRQPDATAAQSLVELAKLRLPTALVNHAYHSRSMSQRQQAMAPEDPISLALHVAAIFDRLGIRCVVGGAVASSIYGEPRATEDVDVVADIRPHHIPSLMEGLTDDFYVDQGAVARAVSEHKSFNAIHLPSARKVDVYVPPAEPFYEQQIERRRLVTVSQDPPAHLFVLAPEDAVLQKLEWYRKGGMASDRQWRDVLGVLKVQQDRLDWEYLNRMAGGAGLDDLLADARTHAGVA